MTNTKLIASLFALTGAVIAFLLALYVRLKRYYKGERIAQQAATNAKSAFLAQISHEIRTPMNTILGMNELILREEISDKAREYALLCKRAGTNMLAIINDILDFSKIEAGKLKIRHEEYSFASLINDAISIIRTKINEKPILFAANIDGNIPRNLVGDELRIKQILLNILSNAVKYTDEGFVLLAITCEVTDGAAILTVDVSDSGVGLKEESIKYLFEQFSRVDESRNRNVEGTGLGLAIVKKLCDAMNGKISLKSEYGVGSAFTFTVPQGINQYEKLAEVEGAGQIKVLIYEPRLVYAKSLIYTFENLGVGYSLTASRRDFYNMLEKERYQYIFISSFLYKTEKQLQKLKGGAKIVLITEFEEVYTTREFRTITMPAHSFVISNILNSKVDSAASYYRSDRLNAAFMAPSAKVLIVDDMSTNLTVVEGLLAQYKMQIDVCKSGIEAVNMVSRSRYDIIFMDHAMPGMDGIEATSSIRAITDKNGYYQNVPIIAMTANVVSGMREIYLNNGMNDYLAKPIEVVKLDGVLKKWLPKEKQEKTERADGTVAENQTDSAEAIEIEGIDAQIGLLMDGGIISNYLKTLNVFCKDGFEKAGELRNCLNNNDIELFTILTHGLKNALWNIGAKKLSDFAKALEKAGKAGAALFIAEYGEMFLTELETLLQNIDTALVNYSDERRDRETGTVDYLKDKFTKLRAALESMDVGQINEIIREVEAKRWDKEIKVVLNDLLQLILIFEYDRAIGLIDKTLKNDYE